LQVQDGRSSEALFHKKRKEELTAAFEKINLMVRSGNIKTLHHPDQMAELGRLFLIVGHEAKGLQWLYTTLRIMPQHRVANEVLAAYYERNNEPEKAKRHRQAVH